MKESRLVLLAVAAAIILGIVIAASHNDVLIRAADAVAPIGTLWVNAIRIHLSDADCIDPAFPGRALPYPAPIRAGIEPWGAKATPEPPATL